LLDEHGCFLGPAQLMAALVRWRRSVIPAIRAELLEQIRLIMDHGVRPTHANGHQYVELFPYISSIVIDVLRQCSIPVVRCACEQRLASTTLRSRGVPAWMMSHVKRQFALRAAPQFDAAGLAHADDYFGTAHAGHVTLSSLSRWFRGAGSARLLE